MRSTIQAGPDRVESVENTSRGARLTLIESSEASTPDAPLVVDLDGTLLRTDLLQECALRLVKQKPASLLSFPFWLLRGRPHLKNTIFSESSLDTAVLPFNQELLLWLRLEKERGRRLILATASDQSLAKKTVEPLNLFDVVLGSTPARDLKGVSKIAAIEEFCGTTFDYAGNSSADLPVWKASRKAIVVNASKSVEAKARRQTRVIDVSLSPRRSLMPVVRSLRLYQWVKNLLLFVPVFTSHQWANGAILLKTLLAFLAFGLCASGTYLVNDLLDLEEDRRHLSKRNRPLASGECSIQQGVTAAVICLVAGLTLGFTVGNGLLPLLLLYMVATASYSLSLKKIFLVDALTLALLYTLRVIAGHVLTGIPFSMWLLSFSFFLFLSLAFSKRAAELINLPRNQEAGLPGRGYLAGDLQLVTTAGVCSGFLSSLVFALYVNSPSVTLLYRRPAVLWGILPLLLYYILRVWIVCGRGQLDVDPIVYTAKSRSTYVIGAMIILLVVAATVRF